MTQRAPLGAGGGTDAVLRLFPGAVRIAQATDADLERIAQGSIRRRGVQGTSPPFRRPVADEQQLDAFCQWLSSVGLDLIGVVTYSDEYADRHGVKSLSRALDDVQQGLSWVPMNDGRRGWPFEYVLAGEWHRTGRAVPHVHLALSSHGHDSEELCYCLRRHFDGSRGRSRFELMRDTSSATLYGLKDTVKSTKHDPDTLRLRLTCARRRKALSGSAACSGKAGKGPAALLAAGA